MKIYTDFLPKTVPLPRKNVDFLISKKIVVTMICLSNLHIVKEANVKICKNFVTLKTFFNIFVALFLYFSLSSLLYLDVKSLLRYNQQYIFFFFVIFYELMSFSHLNVLQECPWYREVTQNHSLNYNYMKKDDSHLLSIPPNMRTRIKILTFKQDIQCVDCFTY